MFRENFAKICIETLLQYSLLEKNGSQETQIMNGNGNVEEDEEQAREVMSGLSLTEEDCKLTNKLAVTSLLHRFKDVLIKYIADEKLSSPVPLASHRVAELSFVLKSLTTLISSLKRGQAPGQVMLSTLHSLSSSCKTFITLSSHLSGGLEDLGPGDRPLPAPGHRSIDTGALRHQQPPGNTLLSLVSSPINALFSLASSRSISTRTFSSPQPPTSPAEYQKKYQDVLDEI